MVETFELRWFLDAMPAAFRGFRGRQEARVDWYAPVDGGTSSVKLREARLEAKFLCEEIGFRLRGRKVTLQRWSKTSRPLLRSEAASISETVRAHWIAVRKQRVLRHCSVLEGRLVPQSSQATHAVQIESTRITLPGEMPNAWTCCLEIPVLRGQACLERVADALFEELLLDVGSLPQVESYPAWLCRNRHQTEVAPGGNESSPPRRFS